MKKNIILLFLTIFLPVFLLAQGGDGMDHKVLSSYQNEEETARKSIHFTSGYTVNSDILHAFIDPDIPYNGGQAVTDGKFNMNYIRSYAPVADNATQTEPEHENLDHSLWNEDIEYFDGLGRLIQKIAVKAAPRGADIIFPLCYDGHNRTEKEYLPMSLVQEGAQGAGGYRPDAFPEQEAFNKYFYEKTDHFAYSEIRYDNSPLNRKRKAIAPGEAWKSGTERPVEYGYLVNKENGTYDEKETIFIFKATSEELKKESVYAAGTLVKTRLEDEDNNVSLTFKDLDGRIVCEKKQNGTEWLATYYVYNAKGLLRYVLPPKAMNHISEDLQTQTFDYDEEWIRELCYYYEYDNKKRMTLKRLPGAKSVYLVYNQADMLVMSQDGNQWANNQWAFTKYDAFDRPIITGIHQAATAISQSQMQQSVNNTSVLYEEKDIQQEHWYTSNAYPNHNDQNCKVNTVSFYDEYIDQAPYNTVYKYDADHTTNLPDDEATNIKGLLTMTKTRILENSEINMGSLDDFMVSVSYYDNYSRPIQSISDNHLGGHDKVSNIYNFSGDLLLSKESQTKGSESHHFVTANTFDHRKRLMESKEIFQGQNYITRFDYDEMGKQKRIRLVAHDGKKLQNIDYKYNMRGWLTDINNVEKTGNDLFALKLQYDQTNNPQYNGNISSGEWYSPAFGVQLYDYTYDNTGRLKTAVYSGQNTSLNYNTAYGYDKNGNIESLSRYGNLGASSTCDEIDQLTYTYTGNKLLKVDDMPAENYQNNGFKDNGTMLPLEYSYDFNGNMIEDKNKDLTVDEYNLLNLPQKISITGTSSGSTIMQGINYLYTATGTKLRKQTRIDHQISKTFDYAGRFVYSDVNGDNTVLAYLMAAQGRITIEEDGSPAYEYSLKDHLGNTRITFDENLNILQEDAYYPFGMNISGLSYSNTSPENKYRYNGKELQDDFGLDWYDYGARMYDAELGRWHVPDPLAEKTFSLSPFRYGKNNPVFYVDVKGLSEFEQSYSSFSIGRYGSITAHASGSSGSDEAEKTDSKEKDKLPAWLISFNKKNKLKIKMFGSSLKRDIKSTLPSLSESVDANSNVSSNMSTTSQGSRLFHANYWLGLSTTFLAGGRGFGMTLDNFKSLQTTSDYYKWGLSYSKEIAKTSNWIKGLKIGGVVTSGVSLMFTYNDWEAGKISDGKFAIDAGMTLYSHFPVVGWAAGLQYYIIDNTIGYENFMDIQINQANERANMINNGNWGAAMWRFGGSIR